MADSLFRISGKAAFVTGGARGIGKAIARLLAEQGATVVVADIIPEAEETAAELAQLQPGCFSVHCDVTKPGSIAAAMAVVETRLGHLEILVNNAGINTAGGRVTIETYNPEDWHRILQVDLDGVFNVSQAAIPLIKRSGGGRIVNISSVVGLVPARLQCAYVAAKAGVANLTRAMALELAPDKILVNSVAPGSTLTEGTRQLFYGDSSSYPEKVKSLLSHIALGRPGETEEIAAAVLFLASPAASYITGVVLPVDGGWTAGYIREW